MTPILITRPELVPADCRGVELVSPQLPFDGDTVGREAELAWGSETIRPIECVRIVEITTIIM